VPDTHGNLKIWDGSLGFATEMKVPPLEEPPVLSDECTILTDSSSSSPFSLGRRRAAILTLCMDAMVASEWRAGGEQSGQYQSLQVMSKTGLWFKSTVGATPT
jgi:hypothetical protein